MSSSRSRFGESVPARPSCTAARCAVARRAGWTGRRSLLRAAVALPLALVAAGCGFHLRGDGSYGFTSVFVSAPTSPPLEAELRRTLSGGSGAALAETAAAAQVVLTVSEVTEDKSVLSLSSGGRVREFALAKRVVFRVADKEGREWIAPQEIVVRRTYLYDDTQRLAREIQENRLLREMQTDAVQQIVRQLQTAKAPG